MIPPNLKIAILEFIANEFKLDPHAMGEDISFQSDLGLNLNSQSDLLTRMQEALDFSLPEDKVGSITTIEDLFTALASSDAEPEVS